MFVKLIVLLGLLQNGCTTNGKPKKPKRNLKKTQKVIIPTQKPKILDFSRCPTDHPRKPVGHLQKSKTLGFLGRYTDFLRFLWVWFGFFGFFNCFTTICHGNLYFYNVFDTFEAAGPSKKLKG